MVEPHEIEITSTISLPRAVLSFRYARSSGPGGQNVNKLNTKATLTVTLDDLAVHLPTDAMARLKRQAVSHLTEAGLQISSDESRSQIANRNTCIERLVAIIRHALIRPRKRKPTKPTRASRERRLQSKKRRSDIKKMRSRRPEG